MQLDLAHVPASEDARTSRPSEIFFLAGPHGHRDEPEPGDGGPLPNLVDGGEKAAVDSHRGHLPLLVNDHERPSPDGATQGSSV